MSTTTISHTTTAADGRTITAEVRGPADGPAVVLLHPAPGSRRFDPDPAATASAGVRLVTIDRAGYGGSGPLADGMVPTIGGHADDTAAVLDDLGVTDAVVVGWSAGGRVAAALAARRPELVRALFIVGTPAPDEEVPWIPDEQRGAIEPMRADPAGSVGFLAGMLAGAGSDPAGAVAMMTAGPADEAALADPAVRVAVEVMLAEAFTSGAVGAAADIVSYTAVPWGFDPAAIGAPTTVVSGADDVLVPPAHGAWWASHIPEAAHEVIAGAGHLVIRPAWPRVLTAAATR
ncbi:MAG: alpha/beta fold hydrolase [Actinomycetota bacterium]|nr:alpha/beta fold hydrolase [Actinomycetota bacterium]